MGLIEKAIGKALDIVPLNKAVGEIPILTTIKWTYRAAKAGYAVGTAFDNFTGASNYVSKDWVKNVGPAPKGLINAVDKGEQLYKQSKGLYDKGKGIYDKLVNKAKSIAGTGPTKTLTQNPSVSKGQGSYIKAALQTKNPTISSPSKKTPTTSSIKIKAATKLKASTAIKPKFKPATNKGLTIKTKTGVSKFNAANNKMFTIKPQATKFNAANNKMFTIKPQASKFNTLKSKIFTIKPKPSAFKMNPIKSNVSTPKTKTSFTLKPNMTKSAFPKNAFKPSINRSTLNRHVKMGPFKR